MTLLFRLEQANPNVRLIVGHDDEILTPKTTAIARSDVARVMVAALDRTSTDNLRFDLCAATSTLLWSSARCFPSLCHPARAVGRRYSYFHLVMCRLGAD